MQRLSMMIMAVVLILFIGGCKVQNVDQSNEKEEPPIESSDENIRDYMDYYHRFMTFTFGCSRDSCIKPYNYTLDENENIKVQEMIRFDLVEQILTFELTISNNVTDPNEYSQEVKLFIKYPIRDAKFSAVYSIYEEQKANSYQYFQERTINHVNVSKVEDIVDHLEDIIYGELEIEQHLIPVIQHRILVELGIILK